MWQNKIKILQPGVRLDKQMKNTEDIHTSHLKFLRLQQYAQQRAALGKQNISVLKYSMKDIFIRESVATRKKKWYKADTFF